MCFLARKRSLRWPSWIKACGLCFSGVVPASRPRVHGVLSQKAISIKPRDRGFESHSEQLFLKIPLPSVFACRHKKREKLLGLCLQIRARIRRRSEKKSEPDCRADGEKSNGNDSLFSLHKETRQQNGAPKSATVNKLQTADQADCTRWTALLFAVIYLNVQPLFIRTD